jgi:hypothetical protein
MSSLQLAYAPSAFGETYMNKIPNFSRLDTMNIKVVCHQRDHFVVK